MSGVEIILDNFTHIVSSGCSINAESFEQIYKAYWTKVYSTCYSHLKDKELSKELTQDIFKSLWERKDTLEIKVVENYLIRAARFKVSEYYRIQASHEEHQQCALQDHCYAEECTKNEVLYNNLNEQVNILVDKLPCQCREIYKLSREQGLNNKQIATTLLISEKTVENQLTKALRFLKTNLIEYQR